MGDGAAPGSWPVLLRQSPPRLEILLARLLVEAAADIGLGRVLIFLQTAAALAIFCAISCACSFCCGSWVVGMVTLLCRFENAGRPRIEFIQPERRPGAMQSRAKQPPNQSLDGEIVVLRWAP